MLVAAATGPMYFSSPNYDAVNLSSHDPPDSDLVTEAHNPCSVFIVACSFTTSVPCTSFSLDFR